MAESILTEARDAVSFQLVIPSPYTARLSACFLDTSIR